LGTPPQRLDVAYGVKCFQERVGRLNKTRKCITCIDL